MFGRKKKSNGGKPKASKPRKPFRVRAIRALKVSLVAGVCALVGGFCWYVTQCDYLRVAFIGVKGAEVLDKQVIVNASGITRADNILFVDCDAVRERVEKLSYVKTCTVTREFPDFVIIDIVERKPVAILVVHNQPHEIDAECVVLRRVPWQSEYSAPVITQIPDLGTITPGDSLADHQELIDALGVAQAFGKTRMSTDVTVSEIAARHVNDIRMYCNELEYEIRWGRRATLGQDAFDRQAQRLDHLWVQKGRELDCKEYLELRFGRDLACK